MKEMEKNVLLNFNVLRSRKIRIFITFGSCAALLLQTTQPHYNMQPPQQMIHCQLFSVPK
jgi:hypothetical protein